VNAVSTHKRKYELKARAVRQRRTRERIVAATVALHKELGPARTTIADIARRAGVQRLTVYNTFPRMGELFAACQGRFLSETPPPDLNPQPGLSARHGLERTLTNLYSWYCATEAMERNVHRDRHLVPELDELMARTGDVRFAAVAEAHAAAIAGAAASPSVKALVRLGLEFRTWELLTGQGLRHADIARLMTSAAAAAGREVVGRSRVRAANRRQHSVESVVEVRVPRRPRRR